MYVFHCFSVDEGLDFDGISMVLSFATEEQEKCVSVPILEDTLDDEGDERFLINLELITDSAEILLQPFSASVRIIGTSLYNL